MKINEFQIGRLGVHTGMLFSVTRTIIISLLGKVIVFYCKNIIACLLQKQIRQPLLEFWKVEATKNIRMVLMADDNIPAICCLYRISVRDCTIALRTRVVI